MRQRERGITGRRLSMKGVLRQRGDAKPHLVSPPRNNAPHASYGDAMPGTVGRRPVSDKKDIFVPRCNQAAARTMAHCQCAVGSDENVKRGLSVLVFAMLLNGCATRPQSIHSGAHEKSSTRRLVDYAGNPCGDQNMKIKAPVCLFPRWE
jgi:hypothetical protein